MYLDYLGALNAVASIPTRGIQGNPDRREKGLVKTEAETEATWPNDQDAGVVGGELPRAGGGRKDPPLEPLEGAALPMPGCQATRGWVWGVLVTFFI